MIRQTILRSPCQLTRCLPKQKLQSPLQTLTWSRQIHTLQRKIYSCLNFIFHERSTSKQSVTKFFFTASACKPCGTSLCYNQDSSNKRLHLRTHADIKLYRKFQSSSEHQQSETKALTIWSDVKELRSSPMPALLLGLSGLIPFMAMPAYMISQQLFMPEAVFAQVAYGACILSFLGGVRWGLTLPKETAVQPDWINLGYSVSPSLIAWTGLMLPSSLSLLTVMAGLALTCYMDLTMFGYPPWFKGLRFVLSFVAILALWTSFMCRFIMNEKKANSVMSVADSEENKGTS